MRLQRFLRRMHGKILDMSDSEFGAFVFGTMYLVVIAVVLVLSFLDALSPGQTVVGVGISVAATAFFFGAQKYYRARRKLAEAGREEA